MKIIVDFNFSFTLFPFTLFSLYLSLILSISSLFLLVDRRSGQRRSWDSDCDDSWYLDVPLAMRLQWPSRILIMTFLQQLSCNGHCKTRSDVSPVMWSREPVMGAIDLTSISLISFPAKVFRCDLFVFRLLDFVFAGWSGCGFILMTIWWWRQLLWKLEVVGLGFVVGVDLLDAGSVWSWF